MFQITLKCDLPFSVSFSQECTLVFSRNYTMCDYHRTLTAESDTRIQLSKPTLKRFARMQNNAILLVHFIPFGKYNYFFIKTCCFC